MDEFVMLYLPGRPRSERVESERFKSFAYEELVTRDKANLDLLWLKQTRLLTLPTFPLLTCWHEKSSRNLRRH